MNKKQWLMLKLGQSVKMDWPQLDGTVKQYTGTVIRFNSGCSQALIKWDNGNERWHGRLSIDLNPQMNPTSPNTN